MIDYPVPFAVPTIGRFKLQWVSPNLEKRKRGRKKGDPRNLQKPENMAMRAMFERGDALQQIGSEFQLTRERVRQLALKHGWRRLQKRPPKFGKTAAKKAERERRKAERIARRAEIVSLYEAGVTLERIARQVGLKTAQRVNTELRLAGVPAKRKGAA